jgi:phage terminase large subunit
MKANPNYTYLCRTVPSTRMTLLQGGTRSGKTFAVIYYLIKICRDYPNAGLEIDLVRDIFTALKATAWKDFKDVLLSHGLYNEKKHNKTDHVYQLNGNNINYYGADSPDKIHGRSRDLLWINEAHQFPQETVDQLLPRTRHRIICDYNPAIGDDHWLDEYITLYPPFISTYRDNPHLTASQVADIERRKGQGYWWQVYGQGKRAARQGVIFEAWQEAEFDASLPYAYGLDFGYYPDPTALVQVAIDEKRKRIYLKELLYTQKLSTEGLTAAVQAAISNPRALVIADSAEPRTIADLGKARLNVQAAVKGPDSVRSGLVKMQAYKIIVDPQSYNLKKELNNYVWNDKKSTTPVDDYNHLIDAARYAFMRLAAGKAKGVKRRN